MATEVLSAQPGIPFGVTVEDEPGANSQQEGKRPRCCHFLRQQCHRGSNCEFSHEKNGQPCQYGNACLLRHHLQESKPRLPPAMLDAASPLVTAREAIQKYWILSNHDPQCLDSLGWLQPSNLAHVHVAKGISKSDATDNFLPMPGFPISYPPGFVPEYLLCLLTWKDQGWGWKKGRVSVGHTGCTISISEAGHEYGTVECVISVADRKRFFVSTCFCDPMDDAHRVLEVDPSDGTCKLSSFYKVGGGGGHQLQIKQFVIIALSSPDFETVPHAIMLRDGQEVGSLSS